MLRGLEGEAMRKKTTRGAQRDDTQAAGARYRQLDRELELPIEGEGAIRPDVLMTFPYQHPGREIEVQVVSEEFTAVCPWTGLPDQGTLEVRYTPARQLLELKSFKYYLLSFRAVGLVQEHAAARILEDLVAVLRPRRLRVELAYRVRGGLGTRVVAEHPALARRPRS
jgi:7-cyano-7-deazaguanine reductase